MDKIRIGIIGLGRGHGHARRVVDSDRCELVSIADIVEQAAEEAAEELGADSWYKDYKAMLDAEDLDATIISTPNYLHAPMSLDCLDAGLDVLVEKPMCNTMDEANEMVKRVEETGNKIYVGYNYRWKPSYQKIKELLDEEVVGKLLYANSVVKSWRTKKYYQVDWKTKWETQGGGVLMNQATHHLDSLSWWMGEAKMVIGYYENLFHDMEVEDTATGIIKFKSGATLNIMASTGIKGSTAPPFEFNGTKGALSFANGGLAVRDKEDDEWERVEFSSEKVDTTMVQLDQFINSVINDDPPAVSAEDGRKALELSLAIYESSRQKSPVELPL